jgi:hypothetical protein
MQILPDGWKYKALSLLNLFDPIYSSAWLLVEFYFYLTIFFVTLENWRWLKRFTFVWRQNHIVWFFPNRRNIANICLDACKSFQDNFVQQLSKILALSFSVFNFIHRPFFGPCYILFLAYIRFFLSSSILPYRLLM